MTTVNYNYDFNESISWLIDEEVKRRIDNAIEIGIDKYVNKYISDYSKAFYKLSEARCEIDRLKNENTRLHIAVGADQYTVLNDIFGGYNIGDKCYIISDRCPLRVIVKNRYIHDENGKFYVSFTLWGVALNYTRQLSDLYKTLTECEMACAKEMER